MFRPILIPLFMLLGSQPGISAKNGSAIVLAPGPIWTRHVIDDTSKGADGVKLGDIDRDGLLDIVTGWEEGGEVRVYRNPGPAAARKPWPCVTVGKVAAPEEAIFVDIDNDGGLDVLSGAEGKTRTIFLHRMRNDATDFLNADSWTTVPIPVTANAQAWMQAVVLDPSRKQNSKMLLASKNEGAAVGWLRMPASGDVAWATYRRLRDAGWIMSLIAHDMDGDGDEDVVLTDRKGARTGAYWLENPGPVHDLAPTAWKEHTIGAIGRQEVMFADLADIDGDGRLDLAVPVKPYDVNLYLRQADGGWREKVVTLNSENIGRAKAVKIADLNGDGLADLLFTCEGAEGAIEGIVWLEQQKNGPWKQRPLGGPAGWKYDLMQVLDLDGDGDLDVITCEEKDGLGVIWYENLHR